MRAKFKDYSIQMQDSTGRVVTLYINGDSLNEMIASVKKDVAAGWRVDPVSVAREMVESDAFERAIYNNEIGADAWII